MSVFENNIASVNLPLFTNSGNAGVVYAYSLALAGAKDFPPSILFPLETAVHRFHADAVYFRFSDERKAYVPEFYLFDYTKRYFSAEEKKRIHLMMWNGFQVPAYMIIEEASISIYNARLNPSNEVDLATIVTLSADAFSSFSSLNLSNGLFWEKLENESFYAFDQSATHGLILGLKKVYASFQSKSGLDKHVALRLLMQCLLIKYLEERDETSDTGYFASHYFNDNFGCNGFCDTIRSGKLLDLLDLLAKDFNGKIFEWNPETQSHARKSIQKAQVRDLANYLDANVQDDQYVLWRLYSFSFLPVEVISSVYEELLTDSKDIVYTPEMIVTTLIDECMPLENPRDNFKMIDVSCGSGIFLVKAYKRLVQWWRYNNWKATGNLEKPSLQVLKSLLEHSIHGVDIGQDAVNLSVFSLALAILDEVDLTPPTWEELKFPDLSENIACGDFFQYITAKGVPTYDLVIGNPPFNIKGEGGKEPDRKRYFRNLKQKYGYESGIQIPDEHPALHFLWSSMPLLKEGGLLCMIQPSGPLFYQEDQDFKKAMFGRYNLQQVLDFTNLDDKLWGTKRVATAAVFIQNQSPDQRAVLHLIANRAFPNTHKLFLEFDHYDFHWVDKSGVIHDPYIWKSNLLGGRRVSLLLNRFSRMRSLGKYLDEKKEKGWVSGEGFMEVKGETALKKADYITGHPYLDARDFRGEKDVNVLTVCTASRFHRPRRQELYMPPHLLFRKIVPFVLCYYDNEYVTFRDSIFAIHAPEGQEKELRAIESYFKDNGELLHFLLMAMSSRVGILKATSIYARDLTDLPYPESNCGFSLNAAEKIVISDALTYYGSPRNKKVHQRLYNEKASLGELAEFGDVFCKGVNSVLEAQNKVLGIEKVFMSDDYIGLLFSANGGKISLNTESFDNLKVYLDTLLKGDSSGYGRNRQIWRIYKVSFSGGVLLVKPAQRRYWLRSVALRDSDELFSESLQSNV